jgi:hypothetical protein
MQSLQDGLPVPSSLEDAVVPLELEPGMMIIAMAELSN